MIDAFCTTGPSPTHSRTCPSLRSTLPLRASPGGGPAPTTVTYELFGRPTPHPATVVLGGISSDAHLVASSSDPSRGWWENLIGRGYGLDPDHGQLLSIDYLEPDARHVLGPDRRVTVGDQVDALRVALDAADLRTPVNVVGVSFGGLVALAFAARHPERTAQVVTVAAAHRPQAWAAAVRGIQRRVLELGVAAGAPRHGVALARTLATLTYSTASEFEGRLWSGIAPHDRRAVLDGHLRTVGSSFARAVRPDRFAALIDALDRDTVDPATIRVPLTAVSVDGDQLVPPWLVDELVREAGGPATHVRLTSPAGHDAFLDDIETVGVALRQALTSEVAR